MCPDINDPGALTVAGQPVTTESSDPFDLEGRTATPAAAPTPSAPATTDPGSDRADSIRASILSNDGSTELRDGISHTEPPEPEFKPEPLDPETQKILAEGQRLNELEAQELAAGREALQTLALQSFAEAYDDAESVEEVAAALVTLRPQIPESDYLELVDAVAAEWSDIDYKAALEFDDDAAFDRWDEASENLKRRAETIEALRAVVAADHAARGLLPAAAAERAQVVHGLSRQFSLDQGFRSDAEANDALQAAKQFAREQLDVDLDVMEQSLQPFDAKAYDAVLRSSWAAIAEQAQANESRDIQQSLLDTETTSIADGIERWTPLGWVNPNHVELEPALVDEERVIARATQRRTTAASIKKSLMSEEATSTESGWMKNGKPVSSAEANSGLAEYLARQKEEHARSLRALLP